MLTAVERKRKRRRKRNTRKRRNTKSTRSIRRRRVVGALRLEMYKKTRAWRRMESQERLNPFLWFLLSKLSAQQGILFSCLTTLCVCARCWEMHIAFPVFIGIWQWSRWQLGWPGEAPERESPAFHEKGPDVSIPDVLKTRACLTLEIPTHSWCLSSTWFSFRMYKLLNLESSFFLFFFSFYWFGTFWRVCFFRKLILSAYYLNC